MYIIFISPQNISGGDFAVNRKTIAKGLAVGTVAGIAFYGLSQSSMRKKHSLKKNAGKALRAAGSVIDEITSIIM